MAQLEFPFSIGFESLTREMITGHVNAYTNKYPEEFIDLAASPATTSAAVASSPSTSGVFAGRAPDPAADHGGTPGVPL